MWPCPVTFFQSGLLNKPKNVLILSGRGPCRYSCLGFLMFIQRQIRTNTCISVSLLKIVTLTKTLLCILFPLNYSHRIHLSSSDCSLEASSVGCTLPLPPSASFLTFVLRSHRMQVDQYRPISVTEASQKQRGGKEVKCFVFICPCFVLLLKDIFAVKEGLEGQDHFVMHSSPNLCRNLLCDHVSFDFNPIIRQ